MMENKDRINLLLEKLETLLKRQDSFSREIDELRKEIISLKIAQIKEKTEVKPESISDRPRSDIYFEARNVAVPPLPQNPSESLLENQSEFSVPKSEVTPKAKSNIEKFIGENLINKIGIIITIIGVTIGAKYSIEHQLISPVTRIVLGYVIGLGLFGFGAKLKRDYIDFSAVLVSGAIAIMYFITYFAYSFYGLMPQIAAFSLMVVFTVFTVGAAINYNRQVIAHIGLVGAYAVPFLLSDGSGKEAILFSYIAIINIGILFIALKKYWKSIYYSSFLLTWFIFILWFVSNDQAAQQFGLSLTFLSIFFAIFYIIFLGYKLIQKEKFGIEDVVMLLANSFIFYGLGYALLNNHPGGEQLLGLFTVCNALIHLSVSAFIYSQKLADRNLFFLVAGLFLVFMTIAIPVQLDGNWVTLLWAGEAALLFWIGRTKHVSAYEKIAYALMFLAFFSIIFDWMTLYKTYSASLSYTRSTPLFNINFLTALLFILSFVFIQYLSSSRRYKSPVSSPKWLMSVMSFSIPAILLVVIYFSFRMEIAAYWNQLYVASSVSIPQIGQDYSNTYWNDDMNRYNSIWTINYSFLLFSLLAFVNIKKIKNANLALFNMGFGVVFLMVFLTEGLLVLGELRDSYLNHTLSEYYQRSSFNIGIRYVSFAFVGLMITAMYRYCQQDFIKAISFKWIVAFDTIFYSTLLWIANSEWITRMDSLNDHQSYKLGLSLLWGVYALILIVLGIWKKKKHLRIGAIFLFAITLIKLFFYDMAHLGTISKTIVFVSLGILLLIISFLYNKYRHKISGENEN